MKRNGFTLIELLVVIAIIAVMIGLALPNFLGGRQRARDSKKKQEMQQVKTALRLYYNDYQQYPTASDDVLKPLATIKGCGASGITTCPGSCSGADFGAGGAGCDNIYMKKFPTYTQSLQYRVSGTNDDFRLSVNLENASDADLLASQQRCPTAYGTNCSGLTYCLCGD